MVADQTRSRKRRPKQPRSFRSFWESQEISRLSFQKYREDVKDLYDGPRGAVLHVGSMLSLHEPLMGQILREDRFDVGRFQRILDVGAGAGQLLGHLLKHAHPQAELVGCDLSEQMLQRARRRLDSDRPLYITADMTRLPFAENSFDCVTCGWVIEHLNDPRPGLREMMRILQPGGSLLLLATEDTMAGVVVSRTWKCRTYNRKELRQICEEVGLPWRRQFYFSKLHRYLKMGGILVEAVKPVEDPGERTAAAQS